MNLQREGVSQWNRRSQVIWKSNTTDVVVSAKEKVNLDWCIMVGKDPWEQLFWYTIKEGKQNHFVGQYSNNNQRLATRTAKQDKDDMRWRDRRTTSEVRVNKECKISLPINFRQSNPVDSDGASSPAKQICATFYGCFLGNYGALPHCLFSLILPGIMLWIKYAFVYSRIDFPLPPPINNIDNLCNWYPAAEIKAHF